MKKIMILLIALLMVLCMNIKADSGKELERAMTDYTNQLNAITEPVSRKYLLQLDSLKNKFSSNGDNKGAHAVQDEIDRVGGKTDIDIQEREPKELIQARIAFMSQIYTIAEPVNRKYFNKLKALQKTLDVNTDVELAKVIQEELEAISKTLPSYDTIKNNPKRLISSDQPKKFLYTEEDKMIANIMSALSPEGQVILNKFIEDYPKFDSNNDEVNKKFTKNMLAEVQLKADKLYVLIKEGERITVSTSRRTYSGAYGGMVGGGLKIGVDVIPTIDLNNDFLDRFDSGKIDLKFKKYLQDNFYIPKNDFIKKQMTDYKNKKLDAIDATGKDLEAKYPVLTPDKIDSIILAEDDFTRNNLFNLISRKYPETLPIQSDLDNTLLNIIKDIVEKDNKYALIDKKITTMIELEKKKANEKIEKLKKQEDEIQRRREEIELAQRKAEAEAPEVQKKFTISVNNFIKEYTDASSEVKKTSLRLKRKAVLSDIISDRYVHNWKAVIKSTSTNRNGDASISVILLDSNICLSSQEKIKTNTAMFNALADCEIGGTIKFSGRFADSDKDFFKETSITEYGSMTDPEFIINFTDISKIK